MPSGAGPHFAVATAGRYMHARPTDSSARYTPVSSAAHGPSGRNRRTLLGCSPRLEAGRTEGGGEVQRVAPVESLVRAGDEPGKGPVHDHESRD